MDPNLKSDLKHILSSADPKQTGFTHRFSDDTVTTSGTTQCSFPQESNSIFGSDPFGQETRK